MASDFLMDLRFLGVTARVKRLSDALSVGIKELYQLNDIDLEPSWHLVLLYLKQQASATMTEIAEALRLSQPAMTKMIHRMMAKGYLEAVREDSDGRKKNIMLTAKARERLPVFERIWTAGQESIREILDSNEEFLEHLEDFESKIRSKGFADRAMERLGED